MQPTANEIHATHDDIQSLRTDDIPLLSQWIKKSRSEERDFLAGAEGLEPSRTVLETGMLPLHYAPILT